MVCLSTWLQQTAVMVALVANPAYALGINCRGSNYCAKLGALEGFRELASQLEPDRFYQNGENIMCMPDRTILEAKGGYCLFLQGTGYGAPGSSIGGLIESLLEHGCNTCGSVPLFYPPPNNDNDPSRGILTSNYKSNVDGCGSRQGHPVIC